jgi:hypothetical protein
MKYFIRGKIEVSIPMQNRYGEYGLPNMFDLEFSEVVVMDIHNTRQLERRVLRIAMDLNPDSFRDTEYDEDGLISRGTKVFIEYISKL